MPLVLEKMTASSPEKHALYDWPWSVSSFSSTNVLPSFSGAGATASAVKQNNPVLPFSQRAMENSHSPDQITPSARPFNSQLIRNLFVFNQDQNAVYIYTSQACSHLPFCGFLQPSSIPFPFHSSPTVGDCVLQGRISSQPHHHHQHLRLDTFQGNYLPTDFNNPSCTRKIDSD